jgi:hypothetical protein
VLFRRERFEVKRGKMTSDTIRVRDKDKVKNEIEDNGVKGDNNAQ